MVMCRCQPGYRLDSNGRICVGIDRCKTNNGGCDHKCVSYGGRAVCQCYDGYQLMSNQRTCQGIDREI
jgi:hypothetical protein